MFQQQGKIRSFTPRSTVSEKHEHLENKSVCDYILADNQINGEYEARETHIQKYLNQVKEWVKKWP